MSITQYNRSLIDLCGTKRSLDEDSSLQAEARAPDLHQTVAPDLEGRSRSVGRDKIGYSVQARRDGRIVHPDRIQSHWDNANTSWANNYLTI